MGEPERSCLMEGSLGRFLNKKIIGGAASVPAWFKGLKS